MKTIKNNKNSGVLCSKRLVRKILGIVVEGLEGEVLVGGESVVVFVQSGQVVQVLGAWLVTGVVVALAL